MSLLLAVLAGVVLLFNLYATLDIFLGMRKMRRLGEIPPLAGDNLPLVSILVPACNEEETIEPALRSLLALEYGNVEIIVINDRSTDNTGGVLRNMQKRWPRLRIIDKQELPDGWLGKNHALHTAAGIAGGEYLLFTDADILFEKSSLSRAMRLMLDEQLDHLALIFKNIAKGWLLNAMMVDAGGGLFFLFKPWKVRDPDSKNFIGVGAFNLVKKSVYQQIGGHEPLRMHPIDDIMLGKTVKRSGFRQECLTAYDFLAVHWYESPRKMIQGLMKNIFALYNFKVAHAIAAILMICAATILPVWGAFLASGAARLFFAISAVVRLCSSMFGAYHTSSPWGIVPFSLLTPYINIYIIAKGMLLTLINKGIYWRGAFYPLDRLRENDPIL